MTSNTGQSDADWLQNFPVLKGLSEEDRHLLLHKSALMKAPANTVLFGPGNKPENLLLVLEGSVRVQHLSEKGREIVLYRVKGGESCIMTTACLLSHGDYSATGVAETDVLAVAIPRKVFDTVLGSSSDFRQFVFHAYSRRLSDLFLVVEDVAFQRVDVRLAQKVCQLSNEESTVQITHQQLAAELGTAREVVSRQLSEFQRREWIAQTRGNIKLLNRSALERLSKQ